MGKTNQKDKHAQWEERKARAKDSQQELFILKKKIDSLTAAIDETYDESRELPEEGRWEFFDKMPLCERTRLGLERAKFTRLTEVQQAAMPLALAGKDILGAAKTGSGKTLAFVVPLLERLYREKWNEDAGVGALVLTPTRELAMQIFKVLQSVGFKHTFSAALLTGGRNQAEERKRLQNINIVIGTPGRILAHLSEANGLVLDNLLMFTMDEADRLLDMGFKEQLTSIVSYLPPDRQTLLFSATQTTDIQALASLALHNPKHVSVHAASMVPTPVKMNQNFCVVELHRKLDVLLMFLKKHPQDKIIVFVSTCNQVRYMYLALSRIIKKMKIPCMCLTGKMKQFRRDEIFMTFCRAKSAVLFCTDIAARGLDFPLVHWVIQYDCPDSTQTYIHRVGRTARAGARGCTLLMLSPPELPMLSFLHTKKIPLREISVRDKFMQESKEIFVALVIQGLKYEAQKAFIAYLRSIYFAANKLVFDLDNIDDTTFAHSLGLLTVPDTTEIRGKRYSKNLPWAVQNFNTTANVTGAALPQKQAAAVMNQVVDSDDDFDEDGEEEEDEDAVPQAATKLPDEGTTRRERHLKAKDMFDQLHVKQRFNVANEALQVDQSGTDGADDGFFVKTRRTKSDFADDAAPEAASTRASDAKKGAKKGEVDLTKPLTVQERLDGLSKNKKRQLLSGTGDLSIKQLGLSTFKTFENSDDDDDDIGGLGGEDQDEVPGGHFSESDDEPRNQEDFTKKLQSKVSTAKEDDKSRRKGLMKDRMRKKAEAAGLVSDSKKDKKNDDDDSEYSSGDYDQGGDSDSDQDADFAELMAAARGELYEKHEYGDGDSSGDNDDDDEEDDRPAPSDSSEDEKPAKKKRRVEFGGNKKKQFNNQKTTQGKKSFGGKKKF